MLTRRGFLTAGVGLCAASLSSLTACTSRDPIKVAIHTWIGYESLFLADQFSWLPENAFLITNQNATESISMLINGQVHAACLTLDELLLVRSEGVAAKVGLVFNVSAGADMVISRIPINELEDIKGLRVGYEAGALGALVLHHLLKEARLNVNDLVLIDLPPDQQFSAWQKGDVDIVITYEPTASQLLAEGGLRIFDSRNMPERIFDILAVRPDMLNRRGNQQMQQVIEGHFKVLEYMRRQRQDALYRIATRQLTDFEQVQKALGGVHLPSLESNRHYLSGSDKRLFDAATEIDWLMQQLNMINCTSSDLI
jgi:NitT/TauT family transport system substrate-binding protein